MLKHINTWIRGKSREESTGLAIWIERVICILNEKTINSNSLCKCICLNIIIVNLRKLKLSFNMLICKNLELGKTEVMLY